MKTNIVGIIIALILTFVGMLSVYAQDTKAVSYTHLDVYKRQTVGRAWCPKEWMSAYRVRCCLLRWFFSQHWCCVSY